MTRVAIIGAGPSGTAQLRAFASASENGAEIPEIVCYEKQADWGGLWNYTQYTGIDQHGEPVHGSMYRDLWSNGPKECLEFADYTFEEHFGRPIASYPPREVLADYIKGRVKKAGVRKYCRFNHSVHHVSYCDQTEKFMIQVKNLRDNQFITDEADYVVVATGHFSTPNLPHFKGLETFNGRVLHAHDFRDAREFIDQDLLIVGASYSGEDIASVCYKFGSKSVTISHRTEPTGFNWPDNFQEVPLLAHVDEKTAYFKDGSSKQVDAIILCTGYLHHFPFMENSLCLRTDNRMWTPGLYQGVIWQDNPKLIYLGMQDQFYTFNMFDAQAWYARDVIMGRIELPAKADMQKHSDAWEAREQTLVSNEDMIWFQGDYTQALIDLTDYPCFDVEGVNKTFMEWEHHKHKDILKFRDNSYRSLITGNMQPVHHTSWMQAMDDSMQAYLNQP